MALTIGSAHLLCLAFGMGAQNALRLWKGTVPQSRSVAFIPIRGTTSYVPEEQHSRSEAAYKQASKADMLDLQPHHSFMLEFFRRTKRRHHGRAQEVEC